jgi:TetR/AcrR family transcriptional repressor of nem operon
MPKQFESKEKARELIVAAAGRKLRETGFDGIGVDGLMKEAKLTSGAFYTQFNSKKELLVEVLRDGLEGLKSISPGGRKKTAMNG